jgi:hypothetical protein
MISSISRSAVAHFDELVLRYGHMMHEQIAQARREIGLYPLNVESFVLRPFFIEPARYAGLQAAARLVTRAVIAVGTRALKDATLRRRLMLSPEEEVHVASEVEPREPYGRIDGLLQGDTEVSFLEYNTTPVGGAHYTEVMARIFDGLPIMTELRRRFRLRHPLTETRIVPSCLRAFHAHGGRGLPNVAVVTAGLGAPGGPQLEEDSRYQLETAVAAGIPVKLVAPDLLEARGDRLYCGDFAVDCITYLDWRSFLGAFPPSHPLWRAVRAGAVSFFGSFALLATRGNKGIFALLCDPVITADLPRELQQAVARHVPWTRLVRDERTDFHGASIDLLPFLSHHRERFVLKPTTNRGGRGVTLGWESDQATWDAALALGAAGEHPHVAQERVVPSRATYPTVVDGKLTFVAYNQDCNPFTWNEEESDGCLVRLSESGLLNLTAGGTMAPLFLVEPA